MLTNLSVNLNKVALLRNAREGNTPNPALYGAMALKAGAAGLTVHPRPDERHIRPSDVDSIARLLKSWPGREFNIEGNPFMNLLDHVRRVRPAQATFVPDNETQLTSDHGCDLAKNGAAFEKLVKEAKDLGVRVSLFMDPVAENMRLAKEVGADRIELYTASYAATRGTSDAAATLAQYAEAAQAAHEAGLGINAGHDLSLSNLEELLVACRWIDEVSIGHALIGEALEYGITETVGRYNGLCLRARDRIAAAGF